MSLQIAEDKLESQFILRLPHKQAKTLKKYLTIKPKKIKKYVKIYMDPEMRECEVTVKKRTIAMQLVDLPTIVESLKSIDSKMFFKTADICQMLIPKLPEHDAAKIKLIELIKGGEKKFQWPHGLTPPLKNVRKNRFRRIVENALITDGLDIEKEVKWLLQMDSEAVAVRWELIDDDKANMSQNNRDFNQNKTLEKVERELFGDLISDSDDEKTCIS